MEGCPSNLQKQKSKPCKKRKLENGIVRLDPPRDECQPKLKSLKEELALISMGAAVPWILPRDPKALVDLTKRLGYEKGGKTIDSLLQRGSKNLLTLKRELGLQNVRETLEWCMPTDHKLLVELTKELGFNNGAQTLDLLLSEVPQLVRSAAGKSECGTERGSSSKEEQKYC